MMAVWSTYSFERPMAQGWVLHKIAHAQVGAPPGKGCYWDEHLLFHPKSGTTIACPDWEWADLDRGRLVWAATGQLFTGYTDQQGLQGQKLLYDFNEMAFEERIAPY